ncbi:MAG: hypothetical protein WAM14_00165 [Candidatus Nitrosopolaris sp.]
MRLSAYKDGWWDGYDDYTGGASITFLLVIIIPGIVAMLVTKKEWRIQLVINISSKYENTGINDFSLTMKDQS